MRVGAGQAAKVPAPARSRAGDEKPRHGFHASHRNRLRHALRLRRGNVRCAGHTWRAYLSTTATSTAPAVNTRDRIGTGPWYNAEGLLVAQNLEHLHGPDSGINKQTAVTERLDPVNGVGDTPNRHDILTGSRPDGTAFTGSDDRTCGNWNSSGAGRTQVGHRDRMGRGEGANSWNSAHLFRWVQPAGSAKHRR